MIILFDNNENIKTIQINNFVETDYKILKKNLKYLLNNKIKIINFDLFNISDYSYYYVMKIIYFFTKYSDKFLEQFEKFNIYFNENDKSNVEYYSSLASWTSPDNISIIYINELINWKKLIKEQSKLL